MSIFAINQTIRHMCSEISADSVQLVGWRPLTETELLHEMAICVAGSQMRFELAVAIADRLRDDALLRPSAAKKGMRVLEDHVLASLDEPVDVPMPDGTFKSYRPRFKNRLALLLASTMHGIYAQSRSLRGILRQASSAKAARQALIESVFGFGPKQASLFLRRIGYCSDLAVLDVHVLDYLLLTKGLCVAPSKLGRIATYEEVEEVFREVASGFGHSVGLVDLATWLTMRVAKREAML